MLIRVVSILKHMYIFQGAALESAIALDIENLHILRIETTLMNIEIHAEDKSFSYYFQKWHVTNKKKNNVLHNT